MLPERQTSAPQTSSGPRGRVKSVMKHLVRIVLARALYHTGLLTALKRLTHQHSLQVVPGATFPRLGRDRTPKFGILCYHRVGSHGVPLFSRLGPKVFEAQMRYLKKSYRLVSLSRLYRELREGAPKEPTLAVTFDDGYKDLYGYAFPVLQKYKIPATIYLIGQAMETGGAAWYDRIFVALGSAAGRLLDVELESPRRFSLRSVESRMTAAWEIICYLRTIPDKQRRAWCSEFERRVAVPEEQVSECMLNWNQVREMQRGGVSFGAHTMTHPSVSRLEESAFSEELGRTKRLLEDGLNSAVEDFAYPFGKLGDISQRAEGFLRCSGYRSAVTTIGGYNTPAANPFELRRLQIGDGCSLPEFSFGIGRMFLESTFDQTSKDNGRSCKDWKGVAATRSNSAAENIG
jgi:peptidoglycan/xylan/chitin deacetylase (PgdA/CDA1 family)